MQGLTRPEPLPRLAGWAVFGAFAAFCVAAVAYHLPEDSALTLTAGVLAIGLGWLATLGPARLMLPATFLAGAAVTAICTGAPANVGWFAIVVLAAWCALSASVLVIGLYWAAATAMFAVEALTTRTDPGWFAWVAGTAFGVLGCFFGRRQRDLVLQLRDAQAGLANRAQVEERNRIARELHDVIAHSLTVSLLHVSAARLALHDDPADAERALAEAERLGRASLDEVRHAVGTLHRDDAPDPTAPLPGSTDVPALIEGFTRAGADVRATVEADLAALPATVGLATYRILQEALTNAVKHAPAARSTVHLAVVDRTVRLDVDTSGAPKSGAGLGLIGMRERAESLGGRCVAGPGGSGWRVHAELPLEPGPIR